MGKTMSRKERRVGVRYLPWVFFFFALGLAIGVAQGAIDATSTKDQGLRKEPKKIRIAVFDSGKGSNHESKVTSLLKQSLKDCEQCEFRSYPIYNWNGELSVGRFLSALQRAEESADILHFSWNIERSAKTKEIEERILELGQSGKIIVAAAGESTKNGRKLLKLNETVMGSAAGAFLIGELSPRGWLNLRSNYGDELFTALPAPAGLRGSSFSSIAFTSKLAKSLVRYRQNFLLQKLRINRQKSTAPWPRLDRLFEAI